MDRTNRPDIHSRSDVALPDLLEPEDLVLHPAIRERRQRVCAHRHEQFQSISAVSAARLEMLATSLENLTPDKIPNLNSAEYDIADAAAIVLRTIRDRLARWAAGQRPSLAEISATERDLGRFKTCLENWATLSTIR